MQSNGRCAAPRRAGNGGRRRAGNHDLFRLRDGDDDGKQRPALTRALLSALAKTAPSVIVVELGDGLMGAYGVDAILDDEEVCDAMTGVVLCANDPVAAWGGTRLLRDSYGIEPIVVTGPATDNAVGIDQIQNSLGLPAINALSNAAELGDAVNAHLLDAGGDA